MRPCVVRSMPSPKWPTHYVSGGALKSPLTQFDGAVMSSRRPLTGSASIGRQTSCRQISRQLAARWRVAASRSCTSDWLTRPLAADAAVDRRSVRRRISIQRSPIMETTSSARCRPPTDRAGVQVMSDWTLVSALNADAACAGMQ